MFATLASGYPASPDAGETDHLGNARRLAARGEFDHRGLWGIENTLIKQLVAEQQEAGLELLTDGKVRWIDELGSFPWALKGSHVGADGQPRYDAEPQWTRPVYVDAFRFLQSASDQPVRQYLLGPFTLGRAGDPGPMTRDRLTITLAEALGREIRALQAAGCTVVQIDEPAAVEIATEAERALFRAAHRRLLNGIDGIHLMLSVLGGNADRAGPATIFDAKYHSYLFDLRNEPDNWLLVAKAPPKRGVIAGIGSTTAADTGTDADEADDDARIQWAASVLAALRGRGPERVGIAPAGSLAGVSREVARARIERLGDAALDLFEAAQTGALVTDIDRLLQLGVDRRWFGRLDQGALDEARATALPDEDDAPA
jgi:5-methyltetrahydropteroyltriglutamate--homocysteine methyltransferase